MFSVSRLPAVGLHSFVHDGDANYKWQEQEAKK